MQRLFKIGLGLILVVLVSACNGNSDAAAIAQSKQSEAEATINYYQTLEPTMTSQAADLVAATQTMVGLSADLNQAKEQIRLLTINKNGGQGTPQPGISTDTTLAVAPSLGATPGEPGATPAAPGQTTGTPQAGNGVIIDKVNTAKNHPGDLCAAANASTSFTLVADTQIYVVASVRNIKKGNDFTASWKGGTGEIYQNKWTATQNTAKDCIAFYIQPQALGMKAGSYTVIFSAGGISSAEITFTIQ